MSKKKQPIIQKIEFDSQTQEPITIQLKAVNEPIALNEEKTSVPLKEDAMYEQGKQLVMKQVFGPFEKKDSTVNKRQRLLKNLFTLLFTITVLCVISWTIYNDFFSGKEKLPSWSQVGAILSHTWKYLIYAILMLVLTFLAKALKLSVLCKSMTGKFHFWTCVETGIVGLYYNNATPLAVGGQPFEIYHLSKHGVHGGVASSLPIATYFFNQLAYVILGLVALLTFSGNVLKIPTEMTGVIPTIVAVLAYIGLSVSLILPLLVIIFSLKPKIGSKMVAFVLHIGNKLRLIKNPKETTIKTYRTVIQNSRCIKKIGTKPFLFILILLLSFLEHLAGFSIAYFSLKFFGFDWSEFGSGPVMEWAQVIQMCVILSAAISFIPTPGNAGAADLTFYLLFKQGLGISKQGIKYGGFAFPSMITWRILSFYSYIFIGLIFTTLKRKADAKRERLAIEQDQAHQFIEEQAQTTAEPPPINDQKLE